MNSNDWDSIGINYPQGALDIAKSRGWDDDAHLDAVLSLDDDAISLTHPVNLLTEREAERYFGQVEVN